MHFDREQYRAAICERIGVARVAARLTQSDLATKIGGALRTVRSWEKGVVPSADWIGVIADACSVSAEWLIGRPHGDHVPLINRRVETLLLGAEDLDESTKHRRARLATIADAGLEAVPTLEEFALRVARVWTHLDSLQKEKDPDGPKQAGRRRAR